ncbi:MAG: hypothetical protein WC438_01660 [Candidatus Pacearchaeota archaeon]
MNQKETLHRLRGLLDLTAEVRKSYVGEINRLVLGHLGEPLLSKKDYQRIYEKFRHKPEGNLTPEEIGSQIEAVLSETEQIIRDLPIIRSTLMMELDIVRRQERERANQYYQNQLHNLRQELARYRRRK